MPLIVDTTFRDSAHTGSAQFFKYQRVPELVNLIWSERDQMSDVNTLLFGIAAEPLGSNEVQLELQLLSSIV